jgi:hypothetical protein
MFAVGDLSPRNHILGKRGAEGEPPDNTSDAALLPALSDLLTSRGWHRRAVALDVSYLETDARFDSSASCSDRAGAPSSCARSAQLQCTESGGSKRVIGGAYRRTLRGAQRQCQRPGAAFTCRSRGTRLSRDGSAVITTTIGSPASMGRRHATHSNIDILSVVEQHARQIGAHEPP